jgi:hypothetical protein
MSVCCICYKEISYQLFSTKDPLSPALICFFKTCNSCGAKYHQDCLLTLNHICQLYDNDDEEDADEEVREIFSRLNPSINSIMPKATQQSESPQSQQITISQEASPLNTPSPLFSLKTEQSNDDNSTTTCGDTILTLLKWFFLFCTGLIIPYSFYKCCTSIVDEDSTGRETTNYLHDYECDSSDE